MSNFIFPVTNLFDNIIMYILLNDILIKTLCGKYVFANSVMQTDFRALALTSLSMSGNFNCNYCAWQVICVSRVLLSYPPSMSL